MTTAAPPAWIVHRAGPLTAEGLQMCTRCSLVLGDHSDTVSRGDRPVASLAWSSGTALARLNGDAVVTVPHVGALLPDMVLCKASS